MRIPGPIAPQPQLPVPDRAPLPPPPRPHATRDAWDDSRPPPPPPPATVTVAPGDSYYRIAQNLATAQLAAEGLSPGDPSYSARWHELSYSLVLQLQASNGNRPLHPGDVLTLPGSAPVPPDVSGDAQPLAPPGDYDAAFINQFSSDPNGSNGNCGFTSALMTLRLLGIDTSGLGGNTYEQAMRLRALGGAGTVDTTFSNPSQVVASLNAAGARAAIVRNTWGADKLAAVDVMRQAFLSGEPMAFVCCGNPELGWPALGTYDGGHFVTVAGYDPATDTFTVLDPLQGGPIQVTADQLAAYLSADNSEAGEVVQVLPA
ncbi:MAG: C39 family peptidase [Myxococcaceae bacterium]|nr:C39 family peptidase [Myxococcaceae bacterium]